MEWKPGMNATPTDVQGLTASAGAMLQQLQQQLEQIDTSSAAAPSFSEAPEGGAEGSGRETVTWLLPCATLT